LVHLDKLHKNGKYPFNEVKLNSGKNLSYSEWAQKIQSNFEKYFFIEKRNNNTPHDNTYKDYISDDNDYRHEAQLRCNIFVTLAVAPELFNKEHAIKFMKVAEQYLVVNNCIGIRTLDYSDKNYNGYYDVSNDSDNYLLAHGLNYHNGPEWVWPSGFYLMSKMIFNDNKDEVFIDLCKRLIPFETYILKDKWSGLPELTNKDGAFCQGSCPTQAWSIATMIEAIDELAHRYNLLGNNNIHKDHIDNIKKKKVKKIKHDEGKKDNDKDKSKDKGDEEPKEVKKKKKVVKKVVKKHKEPKSDFLSISKEEPTERTEEDASKEVIEVKEKEEPKAKEEQKEEPKEKKVKKVKKVIKKIKKKKTGELKEEKKVEPPSESKPEPEPVSLTKVEHDEKKEEIKEKKEDGPVKKKKKKINNNSKLANI
jgi:glycogen debranching enzyme